MKARKSNVNEGKSTSVAGAAAIVAALAAGAVPDAHAVLLTVDHQGRPVLLESPGKLRSAVVAGTWSSPASAAESSLAGFGCVNNGQCFEGQAR